MKAGLGCTRWNSTTVREILNRQEYLGYTVLRKTIGTNFKTDARRFATDEKRLIFENTHEPIIDSELWERAQRGLKHAVRRMKEGTHQTQCRLPGLVFCADCGSRLAYSANYYKDGTPFYSYRCGNYGNDTSKQTHTCTSHYISEKALCELVLHSLQRISDRVIADERRFAEELKKHWQVQADSKPQEQKETLRKAKQRLEELDRLISDLYENFASGLLPQKQYKSLMQKYSNEQTALENRVAEIEDELKEAKVSSVEIGRFIKLIKKYKEPTEVTPEMACALIDKIVVHEAIGKKPNRQQQIDIYYNFVGQFDLPLTAEEIAVAEAEAAQEAAAKAKCKAERQREYSIAHQAKRKAERWAANDGHKYAKRVCEHCGKEYYPNGNKQKFCSPECKKAHQRAELERKCFAEKGNHTF